MAGSLVPLLVLMSNAVKEYFKLVLGNHKLYFDNFIEKYSSQSQRNPTEPGPLAYEKVAMSKKEFNVNAPPFNINKVERDAVLDKQRNDGRYDIARWNKNQSRFN